MDQLSVALSPITKCFATISTFEAHLKTEVFSAAYDCLISGAGASDSNSQPMVLPMNVFDI